MELDRRQFFAGAASLPLAAALGCGGSGKKPLPPAGEIVGASHERGHRVRKPPQIDLPAIAWSDVEVAIVGGGVAGLSAARALTRQGAKDLAIFELEDVAGGTSRAGKSRGFAYPWGAHYLPAPAKENQALVELLSEFGVVTGRDADGEPIFAEEMLCRDPQERLFLAGQWHEDLWPGAIATPQDHAQRERFAAEVARWATWRDADGRRAFALPISRCSNDAEVLALDQQSFAAWLDERELTSPRLRWWLEYATRDDYGLLLSQTSAWAGLFYFTARVRDDAGEPQPLLTWPEGNGWLVERLARMVRPFLRTGQTVIRIEAAEHDVARIVSIDGEGKLLGVNANQVIYAAPQFTAPFVIAGFPAERAAAAKQFHYGAWLVANLALRERPANVGFEASWDNVIFDSPSLGYVCATHQRGRDHGPTHWTWYYPLTDEDPAAARQRLLAGDWEAWAEFVLADLELAHPYIRPLVERIDVMRWGHAMIQPRVGFITNPARTKAAQAWRNIHFAHSDLSGIALFEEAFDQGTRAGDEVAARR
jgi:protoporphyrinogen oxidase